jgi:hypothetical protein
VASVAEQLQAYQTALADAEVNGDEAIARKLKQQIEELRAYEQRHPDEAVAPSPFEVFCDLNPSDVNCRVYDD